MKLLVFIIFLFSNSYALAGSSVWKMSSDDLINEANFDIDWDEHVGVAFLRIDADIEKATININLAAEQKFLLGFETEAVNFGETEKVQQFTKRWENLTELVKVVDELDQFKCEINPEMNIVNFDRDKTENHITVSANAFLVCSVLGNGLPIKVSLSRLYPSIKRVELEVHPEPVEGNIKRKEDGTIEIEIDFGPED